jgi:hypothetical protein
LVSTTLLRSADYLFSPSGICRRNGKREIEIDSIEKDEAGE